ncbi:pilus (MSHA type) biogenesis protein MshL [Desulforhopalus sp. 52FAK]
MNPFVTSHILACVNKRWPNRFKENRSIILLFVSLTLLMILPGCSAKEPTPAAELHSAPSVYPENEPSLFSQEKQQPEKPTVKHVAIVDEEEKIPLKPKFKELSPLDRERISASFTEETYRPIFQILARAAGLNLVLAPELEQLIGGHSLTAEYQEIKVRTILDAICSIFDVSWHEEHSTLFIEPFISRTVHLDFAAGVNTSSFSVGGDVLGGTSGSSDDIQSPLTGRFEVEGAIDNTVTDIYTNIEATVSQRLEGNGEFLLNRQTGTLMMRARPRLINELEEYLETLHKKYSKQVVIEAQIIEVNLDESQSLGIDWQNINLFTSTEPILEVAQTLVNVSGSSTDSLYNIAVDTQDYSLTAVFSALKQYGNLKVLSNPRIKAMNGQSAMISVGQSVSYLSSLTKTTEGTGDDRSVDITTEIGSIFDGILLGVTPVIKEDNSVTLHIVPIKSEIVSLDQQQLSDDSEDSYSITFPTVNLREISTTVNIRPHTIVVLGGLIMEREQEEESGLPFLSDLPFLGWAFKQVVTSKETVEMVIILKVDVIQ